MRMSQTWMFVTLSGRHFTLVGNSVRNQWIRLSVLVTILALGFFFTVAGQSGQSTQLTPPGSNESARKTAEQEYKNIQVLKGTPSDQLVTAMRFITASLGVDCEFCHVGDQYEKDDKKTKQTARQMIQMQMTINKENFEGRTRVTCNSCHQGRHEPIAVPVIAEEEPKPEPAEAKPTKPEEVPTADQVFSKYLQALGGADALGKITTLQEKGTFIGSSGKGLPIEIFLKEPVKRISVLHTPAGDNITAYDGKTAWFAPPGAPPSALDPNNSEAVRLDTEFNFPSHIKQVFSQFRVGRPEKIKERDVIPVFAIQQGKPPVRLYFDRQSGLLVRMVMYAESPLGRFPTEIDYDDYRDAGQVKIPYSSTVAHTPRGRFTIRIEQVQQNVPVEDSKFAMPAGGK